MAQRYWVDGGSSTNWNATGNTNWSATSGGANNASVPTSADDVFFDSSSGIGNSVISANISIKSLDCAGYLGTITHNAARTLTINGISPVVRFSVGMTYTLGNSLTSKITLNAASGTALLTTNGKTLGFLVFGNGGGAPILSVQDTLTCSGSIEFDAGTLTLNGHNVTSSSFTSNGLDVGCTINMQNITWTITGYDAIAAITYVWNPKGPSLGTGNVVNATGSTIKFTDNSSNIKTFSTEEVGLVYGVLWFTGIGTGTYSISSGSDLTLNTIKDDNTSSHVLQFSSNIIYTVTTLNINGFDCSNRAAVQADTPGNATIISVSSGTVTSDYVTIQDLDVSSGGAIFNATHASNLGGNTGWNFLSSCSSGNPGFLLKLINN